jgi:hypothetical protein
MATDPGAAPPQRPQPFGVPAGPGTDSGNGPKALPPGPVPDVGTGPGTGDAAPVLALASPVVPMTVPERAGAMARRAAGAAAEAARELWLDPGRLLHSLVHGKAESMKEHQTHIQSRAWVPEGMTGRPEKAVVAAGISYHLLIAYPVKAAMKAVKFTAEKVDEAADRPLRLAGLAVFALVLIVLLARYL